MRPMTVGSQPPYQNATMPVSGFYGDVDVPADHVLYTADGAMLYQVPVQADDFGTPRYRDPGRSGGGLFAAGHP